MNTQQVMAAIVARLGAVTDVTDKLGTVPGGYQAHAIYTDVPQAAQSEDTAPFPFITVSPASMQPYDTKGESGGDVLIDVHAWYRGHSSSARFALADATYFALQKHDLAITGANTVDCRYYGGASYKDPDGVTSHEVRTFRVTYFLT